MSAENFIFIDFFAVKFDGSDVTQVSVKSFHIDKFPGDVTSVNVNSKKVYEDEIFSRQDILQFFSGESKDFNFTEPCWKAPFGDVGHAKNKGYYYTVTNIIKIL